RRLHGVEESLFAVALDAVGEAALHHAGANVDELNVEDQRVAELAERAGDDAVHAERAADLHQAALIVRAAEKLALLLEAEGDLDLAHGEDLDPGAGLEPGHQGLGDEVGGLLIDVRAGPERQHRELLPRRS